MAYTIYDKDLMDNKVPRMAHTLEGTCASSHEGHTVQRAVSTLPSE